VWFFLQLPSITSQNYRVEQADGVKASVTAFHHRCDRDTNLIAPRERKNVSCRGEIVSSGMCHDGSTTPQRGTAAAEFAPIQLSIRLCKKGFGKKAVPIIPPMGKKIYPSNSPSEQFRP
jgi:hypothetical protein